MAANTENPILLVKPRKSDHQQRVIAGFGEPKEIVPVTRTLREHLTQRLAAVSNDLVANYKKYPGIPAVISLRLRPEAMAKSHRPMALLERVGMRPVGTQRLGELLLPATQNSLKHLMEVIEQNNAKVIRANISTIDELHPYGADDVLRVNQAPTKRQREQAIRLISEWIQADKPMVLERFTSDDGHIDSAIYQHLQSLLQQLGVKVSDFSLQSSGGAAKIVRLSSVETAQQLASFPGLRSLVAADEFTPIELQPQWFNLIGKAPPGALPAPAPELPIVGVIDTGIPKNDAVLKPWITAHNTYVLPPDTDQLHGTFVAGLIAGARPLNSNDTRFPSAQARILDVSALATTKPGTTFDEMLLAITESVKKYPTVKVLNCSFGSKNPGHMDEFGQFARELDALSDEMGVLFVIAAGNYETQPLRSWPNPSDLAGADRLSQPAESVRALTVGSIAHLDALVAAGDPSPFSRRGPGPAKTPKPDLTHRGGNCDASGTFDGVGVRSLLPGGHVGESIGTSFSTPLVSAIAANVWQTLEKKGLPARPEVVKALLIHAAAISSPKRTPEEHNYHGFGIPESVMDTLFCSPNTFTLMFDADLYDGINWEKTPFPIPACLHPNGTHFRGEIVMTLVYSPPVNGKHGAEYIRANVNASFGSYDPDDDGELHHHGLIPMDAPDKHDLYEEALIDHGFKWSPVKVYRGRFKNGKAGHNFRLKLELLRRAGEPAQPDPQQAVVLITMRGIEPDQPVYNDGIKALRAVQWVTEKVSSAAHINI